MERLFMDQMVLGRREAPGLIVLCGGLSSRMGTDKASLPWRGGTLLTHRLCRGAHEGFGEIIIATNTAPNLSALPGQLIITHPLAEGGAGQRMLESDELQAVAINNTYEWRVTPKQTVLLRIVSDVHKQCGPLSGLEAGLTAGTHETYRVLAVDTPFFEEPKDAPYQTLRPLPGRVTPLCLIPRVDGQPQPLAGLYSKRCLAAVTALLNRGDFKLRSLYDLVATSFFDDDDHQYQYMNMNRPSDYQQAKAIDALLQHQKPIISVVASRSKTGKTLVVEGLIKALKDYGLSVGLVKSDGHGFSMDTPGTDTARATEAGATAVAIAGPNGYAIIDQGVRIDDLTELANRLTSEVVIIESRSRGVVPIIEVVRDNHTEELITSAGDLWAVIGDKASWPNDTAALTFSFDETAELAKHIYEDLLVPVKALRQAEA